MYLYSLVTVPLAPLVYGTVSCCDQLAALASCLNTSACSSLMAPFTSSCAAPSVQQNWTEQGTGVCAACCEAAAGLRTLLSSAWTLGRPVTYSGPLVLQDWTGQDAGVCAAHCGAAAGEQLSGPQPARPPAQSHCACTHPRACKAGALLQFTQSTTPGIKSSRVAHLRSGGRGGLLK